MEFLTIHLVFLKYILKGNFLRYNAFSLYRKIGPTLRPITSDTGAINFTILVEGIMSLVTMHLVFSDVYGSREEDIFEIFVLFWHILACL